VLVRFYTIGGPTIGTGHLFRCLAMKEWFEHLNFFPTIVFEVVDIDPVGGDFAVSILSNRTNSKVRLHADPLINDIECDVLIIDCLQIEVEVIKSFRKKCRLTISIDDIGNGRYWSDIMINPLYAPLLGLEKTGVTHYLDLRGACSQVISPKYTKKPAIWRSEVKNILLLQGGADPHGLLGPILELLIPLLVRKSSIVLNVVVGPASNSYHECNTLLKILPAQIKIHENVYDMPRLMESADLAISSAGVTSFELAAMGVPSILITGEVKEVETAESISLTGAAVCIGRYSVLSVSELLDVITNLIDKPALRLKMRKAGLSLMQGKTGELITKMIRDIIH
jgi:UDP-2,4-diacetamido-2,4,6-trideoxy-beta-L-altropyranose hydrolase